MSSWVQRPGVIPSDQGRWEIIRLWRWIHLVWVGMGNRWWRQRAVPYGMRVLQPVMSLDVLQQEGRGLQSLRAALVQPEQVTDAYENMSQWFRSSRHLWEGFLYSYAKFVRFSHKLLFWLYPPKHPELPILAFSFKRHLRAAWVWAQPSSWFRTWKWPDRSELDLILGRSKDLLPALRTEGRNTLHLKNLCTDEKGRIHLPNQRTGGAGRQAVRKALGCECSDARKFTSADHYTKCNF